MVQVSQLQREAEVGARPGLVVMTSDSDVLIKNDVTWYVSTILYFVTKPPSFYVIIICSFPIFTLFIKNPFNDLILQQLFGGQTIPNRLAF